MSTPPRSDDFEGNLDHRISPQKVRELSEIRVWIPVLFILADWSLIFSAAWFCGSHWSIGLYVLTVAWIGGRQHALLVLMHEAAHHHLLGKRKWDDLVSDLFLAWPHFITTRGFRASHFLHHRWTNDPRDPDIINERNAPDEWKYPMPLGKLCWMLSKRFLGLGNVVVILYILQVTGNKPADKKQEASVKGYVLARAGFYLLLALALTLFHGWKPYLLFWIVPTFTYLPFVLRLRRIAEHYGVEREHPYNLSRTTFPNLLERFLLAPHQIWVHIEHHLYPSVPFYHLPKLHRELLKLPQYQAKAHITHGYWRVLREVSLQGG